MGLSTEVLNYQSDLRIEIEKDPVKFFDTASKELCESIEVLLISLMQIRKA